MKIEMIDVEGLVDFIINEHKKEKETYEKENETLKADHKTLKKYVVLFAKKICELEKECESLKIKLKEEKVNSNFYGEMCLELIEMI